MSETNNSAKETLKPGILRLDIRKDKPRRSSGGSVEFRNQPELQRENLETYQTHTLIQRDEIRGPSGHIIREITTDTDTRTGKHEVNERVYSVGGAMQQ